MQKQFCGSFSTSLKAKWDNITSFEKERIKKKRETQPNAKFQIAINLVEKSFYFSGNLNKKKRPIKTILNI